MTFPVNGDPQLLPKDTIERPTTTRMPFDQRGVLLPNGPAINAAKAAPDIVGLPYTRRWPGDSWSDASMRCVILQWMKEMFQRNPSLRRWTIQEKLTHLRSVVRAPPRIDVVLYDLDGTAVDASIDFTLDQIKDPVLLRTRLDHLATAMEAQL